MTTRSAPRWVRRSTRLAGAPPTPTSTRSSAGATPGPSPEVHADEQRRGAAYGFLAYAIWGAFPLYFAALKPAGAWEILSHRILWTLLLCAGVLLARRDLRW